MDIVVGLALAVLIAVFLFSLFMIIVTCQRKKQYNRLIESQSLRFSKLRETNLDDVVQLGPHLSQSLDRNQWIEHLATGLLQHCVACLKLCHQMTERMAQQQKQFPASTPPELNELICRATSRIMPRFEALLRSMAAPDVDIRIIEARVGALVSACWALASPFAVACPANRGEMEEMVVQMDKHLQALQLALDQFEDEQQRHLGTNNVSAVTSETMIPSTSALSTSTHQDQSNHQNHVQPPIAFSSQLGRRNSSVDGGEENIGNVQQKQPKQSYQSEMDGHVATGTIGAGGGGEIRLRIDAEDESTTSLLHIDETAPADPAIT